MTRPGSTLARAVTAALAAFLLTGLFARAQSKQAPETGSTNLVSEIVEAAGIVEVAVAGQNDWKPARARQQLHPGDRVRTQADSRAALRLSDRSVIRLNQRTVVEIQAPGLSQARRRFRLWGGSMFFFNREKPADVEFQTPIVTGAIRGTEFLLAIVEPPPATLVGLIDGEVELRSAETTLVLTNGQQAVLQPGQPTAVRAVLPIASLVQWSFYYPGILNPSELPFDPNEERDLAESLANYRAGDLLAARRVAPRSLATNSASTRAYFAALELAVGQVSTANELLQPLPENSSFKRALKDVIAAVAYQRLANGETPATSSGWLARSYYLQSRAQLPEALAAAHRAASIAPDFGFASARVAELELGLGHRSTAREALERARQLSPRNAQVAALEGFQTLSEGNPVQAQSSFDRAIELDAALSTAWLGRALCRERLGDREEGRRDLQTAAALEPQRAVLRSYLGKAWGEGRNDGLARKEFSLAKTLDPSDPTAWLYSALLEEQLNQFNHAVDDLEHSLDLNDNRRVFRSQFQLDQDRAVRSADIAVIYDNVGMTEVSQRAASRSLVDDYSNYSGHLFAANSLQAREDPERFDLRLETPRQSELLVANLLAPPGGGNLSQVLSQQDHLEYFDQRPFGASSLTEYGSRGDWSQTATVFGDVLGLSYAMDSEYLHQHGQRPNEGLDSCSFSFQGKQQLSPADSVYLQAGLLYLDSGDLAQHYDPATVKTGLKAKTTQEPNLYLGYHHEWAPGSHTLFLAGRLSDHLTLHDPQPNVIFLPQTGGQLLDAQTDPFFQLDFDRDFTLYSAELQQIWESSQHSFVVGARYQSGSVQTSAAMSRSLTGLVSSQSADPGLERLDGYALYQWRPVPFLHLIGGVGYDYLSFPRNVDFAPIRNDTDHRSLFEPKAGLVLDPWQGASLRAAYSRSLGGLYFDNSIRLEPTQVAGFIDSFRSILPESAGGLVPGTRFETWAVGFDQAFKTRTYAGVEAELLKSHDMRTVGAYTNSTLPAFPDSPSSTQQMLDFEERSVSAYVNQLVGDQWALGTRYRISEADLTGRFPDLPSQAPGVSQLGQDERAVLSHLQGYVFFNHSSGFFAQWLSDWYWQSNRGYVPDRPTESFWQHDFFVGYRFARRRAEIRLGVANLANQGYRLNPLNLQTELPQRRTLLASLRLNF